MHALKDVGFSSSTSTSIMVSMVGAGLLTVDQAIYMVMGNFKL